MRKTKWTASCFRSVSNTSEQRWARGLLFLSHPKQKLSLQRSPEALLHERSSVEANRTERSLDVTLALLFSKSDQYT